MVVNEKALRTRIKEAYKLGGYTVAVDDGVMWIHTGFWLVWINSDEVSNETLSLIALHTRNTPKNGDAYKVIKGDKGPIAQRVLMDTALAVAKTMGHHLEERTSHDENRMLKTQLRYDGACVWQNDSFLSVKLIDPRYEALLESKKDITQLGTGIYLEDTLSGAWIMPVDPKGREAHMKHLSEMRWALK